MSIDASLCSTKEDERKIMSECSQVLVLVTRNGGSAPAWIG